MRYQELGANQGCLQVCQFLPEIDLWKMKYLKRCLTVANIYYTPYLLPQRSTDSEEDVFANKEMTEMGGGDRICLGEWKAPLA